MTFLALPAAEGVFAFFLESGFLGLYLFGRNKCTRVFTWTFFCLMVAVGATIVGVLDYRSQLHGKEPGRIRSEKWKS